MLASVMTCIRYGAIYDIVHILREYEVVLLAHSVRCKWDISNAMTILNLGPAAHQISRGRANNQHWA